MFGHSLTVHRVTATASLGRLTADIPELAFLGKITELLKAFLLLGGQVLLLGHNTAPLIHD